MRRKTREEDRNVTSFCKTSTRQQHFCKVFCSCVKWASGFYYWDVCKVKEPFLLRTEICSSPSKWSRVDLALRLRSAARRTHYHSRAAALQHCTQSVPTAKRAELRPLQPAAWTRATAKLKSSLYLLFAHVRQKKKKKRPENCLKF